MEQPPGHGTETMMHEGPRGPAERSDMIIRIFRATVAAAKVADFETKYQAISVPFMRSCDGMDQVMIGRPLSDTADEYVMVSTWQSSDQLAKALGPDWDRPHIPAGMEHLITSCSVDHYEEMSGHGEQPSPEARQAAIRTGSARPD